MKKLLVSAMLILVAMGLTSCETPTDEKLSASEILEILRERSNGSLFESKQSD